MSIKDFEKKYDINFNGCFAYDALFRLSNKLNKLDEELKDEFIKDFMNLKV